MFAALHVLHHMVLLQCTKVTCTACDLHGMTPSQAAAAVYLVQMTGNERELAEALSNHRVIDMCCVRQFGDGPFQERLESRRA